MATNTCSASHRFHVQTATNQAVPQTGTSLSERLAAAKPVAWRGHSDLHQFAWADQPVKGSWLLLDLWGGFAGLCIACLTLGMHFFALSAECDAEARACASQAMPNIVHIDAVEKLQVRDLRAFIRRRSIRGILLGGGSPCQGNSVLNRTRQGLSDPRSQQPRFLAQLTADLAADPEFAHVEVVSFLENVGSMPPDVRHQYSTWMKSQPVRINAACCGWVQRNRLYWLCSRRRGLEANLRPPTSWSWRPPSEGPPAPPELVYTGAKPVPPRILWEDGYHPMVDPLRVLEEQGKGAMHTFTREFYHPSDRTAQVTPMAAARFHQDHRRFPPGAYEEQSLVWKRDQWRTLEPSERAQAMGVPIAAVAATTGHAEQRRAKQNSLLGNGFHLPSVIVILLMLPQLLEAKLVRQPAAPDSALRARLHLTVWEPGRLDHMPGLLDAEAITQEMQLMLPFAQISQDIWADTARRLGACRLSHLQAFAAWRRLRGESWTLLGPTPLLGRDRTRIFAGVTGQRYASASARGLDHLLPPGLGPAHHMAESARLSSPFRPQDWPEADVLFVVDCICTWRDALPSLAAAQRHILQTVATAVAPLERALHPLRSAAACQVARSKAPALAACLTAILRWPDRDQPRHLLQGYPIVGPVDPCGVFRPICQADKMPMDQWLGPAAEADLQRLLRSQPPKEADTILKITQDEQAKQFCSSFRSAGDLDRLYGPSQWRFMERFLIQQPDGKQRVIDNGRKSGHNRVTHMHETITTVNVDFIATVAQMLHRRLSCLESPDMEQFPWLGLRLGTDDLPDAYRGLAVCDEHLRFSNIAVYVPDVGWRFTTLFGLAYGLESAVVAFNRFPQLGIAVTRRCLLGMTAAYFDDELSLELIQDALVTQPGLQLVFKLLGAPPQPSKSFVPTANRHYLGTSVHVGEAFPEGRIRFQPKSSTRAKVLDHITSAIHNKMLERDTASKLRGDLNWMWSMCAGYIGRLAGPVLTAKQTDLCPNLDRSQCYTLTLLLEIVSEAEPRDIILRPHIQQVMRVYTDASFEDGVLRLGWIIFRPDEIPEGGTCLVPQSTLESWTPRKQQIYPGESLAALVVPMLHPSLFASQDVIWFVDNEAAVSSLIKASSNQQDVHAICQFAHLTLFKLKARIWYEWIDSGSNPSDGLSRLGLADPWTRAQFWHIKEYDFPEKLLPARFLSSFASLIS